MNTKFWQRPQALIWAVLAFLPFQAVLFMQVRNMGAAVMLRVMEGQVSRVDDMFASSNNLTYLFLGMVVLDIALLLTAVTLVTRAAAR